MSAIGTDAITKVISVGTGGQIGQPVLINENMPGGDGAQVINTAATGTLLLGTSPHLTAASSVPLPAGTSVQWTEPGQLWAAAAPDATAPVTIVVSDLISDWQPSPTSIGLAVATQLLNQGIPNVITETTLVEAQAITKGQYVGPIDVSGYASITVNVLSSTDAPLSLGWDMLAPDGSVVDTDQVYLNGQTIRLQVTGTKFDIGLEYNSPGTATITIIGSNRPLTKRTSVLSEADLGDGWVVNPPAGGGAGYYALTQYDFTCQMEGEVYATFTATAGLAGRFEIYWPNMPTPQIGPRASIIVADSAAEMVAMNTGTLYVTKKMAVPYGGGWAFQFLAKSVPTSGTPQASVRLLRP